MNIHSFSACKTFFFFFKFLELILLFFSANVGLARAMRVDNHIDQIDVYFSPTEDIFWSLHINSFDEGVSQISLNADIIIIMESKIIG